MRAELIEPALHALGFALTPSLPAIEAGPGDFTLALAEDDRPLACLMSYAWDRNLDGREDEQQPRDDETGQRNPGAFVVNLLEQPGAPAWAIVTNGKIWRLYAARAHSRATNYYEIDLEEAIASRDPDLAFRYFWLFFRARAFVADPRRDGRSFLDELFQESAQFAHELGERLKERVFEQIFPHFAEGFIRSIRAHEGAHADLGPARLDTVFRGTLTFLYRLLFLLYAESRDLLPLRSARDYQAVSLTSLKTEIARKAGTILDEVPTTLKQSYSDQETRLYDQLRTLFTVVDRGDPVRNVPLYNGGLFLSAPDAADHSPEAESARFLAQYTIPDQFLALGLDRMARDIDPKRGDLVFIDYKSLGVRQFGSIYEGLLEFKLQIATTRMAVVRGKKTEEVVPYAEAQASKRSILKRGRGRSAPDWVLEPGAVYLENDKRERKATGSYYTPDYIVQYIVRQTVEPVLAAKCEALRPRIRQAQQRFRDTVQRKRVVEKVAPNEPALLNEIAGPLLNDLFSLRVCDPAMGSGHFLVEAVDYITDYLVRFMESFPFLSHFFAGMRRSILAGMEQQGVIIDPARLSDVNLLKRHVLKRCVYGVDKNPMAVELAKVSLWLDCFTLGAPLSFLDHHLKCGNSLIGVRVLEVHEAVTYGQLSLFGGSQFAGVMLATDLMRQVGELEDVTAEQLRQSRAEFRAATEALAPYKRILDVYTSRWFGNQPTKAMAKSGLLPTIDFLRDEQARAWLDDPAHGLARLPADRRTLAEIALRAAAEQQFFHWELEFPEVFFSRDAQEETAIPGLKADGGFDVVVGNPPYDEISEYAWGRDIVESGYLNEQPENQVALGGRLNLFRFFIVRAIELLRSHGQHSFIVPLPLLSDQFSSALRKELLSKYQFHEIHCFPQKDDIDNRVFREAKLSTCLYVIEKTPQKDSFEVFFYPGRSFKEGDSFIVSQRIIAEIDPEGWAIPMVSGRALLLIKKLSNEAIYSTFADCGDIFPGEVMLNLQFSDYISDEPTETLLLRGAHIGRYEFNHEPKQGTPKYLHRKTYLHDSRSDSKAYHHRFQRIGFQRGAAVDNWRRLIGTMLPKDVFLTDTVGYILVKEPFSIWFVLSLFQSQLFEWRFGLFSATNHVNAYEVRSLPLRRIHFTTPSAERAARVRELIALYAAGADEELLAAVERYLPRDGEGNFVAFAPPPPAPPPPGGR
ncbi:MAG: N-6 DNA methylase, partial [Oscillochloris sp.]|nr:N-6 DNA methylase [Oscillochloris sp.]